MALHLFLRLQLICTVNGTAANIDPALLRPSRLLSLRLFARLSPSDARRLAATLAKTLPDNSDYSLAEIFAGGEAQEANQPRIGFAA